MRGSMRLFLESAFLARVVLRPRKTPYLGFDIFELLAVERDEQCDAVGATRVWCLRQRLTDLSLRLVATAQIQQNLCTFAGGS
jgi:hypothetical protein